MTHSPTHLADTLIRHWIDVQAFGNTQAAEVADLLAVEDARLVALLRQRLPTATTRDRVNALVADVRAMRKASFARIHAAIKTRLVALARTEATVVNRIMTTAGGLEDIALIDDAVLARMGDASRTIGSAMRDADGRRLVAALRQSIAEGKTADEIIARIAGTRAQRYADGVLAQSRRTAVTEVKTAVTQVASRVQEEWGEANPDAVIGWEWSAILDGATCEVCEGLDGGFVANDNRPRVPTPAGMERAPKGARSPVHHRCRCGLLPIVDGAGKVAA